MLAELHGPYLPATHHVLEHASETGFIIVLLRCHDMSQVNGEQGRYVGAEPGSLTQQGEEDASGIGVYKHRSNLETGDAHAAAAALPVWWLLPSHRSSQSQNELLYTSRQCRRDSKHVYHQVKFNGVM